MKIPVIVTSLLFSLALAGPALAAETVDINSADAETLDRVLDNVGRSKAEAIVAYRDENGPFESAEQLALVKGIGLATVERNLDRIVVEGDGKPSRAKDDGEAR
jgi:competence protein ComEA